MATRFVLAVLLTQCAFAQTTQGVISGRLVNSTTGRPVAAANVAYASSTATSAGSANTDADGYYALPLLSPGTYRVRATAMGFQAQEVQQLELTVASRIDLSFRLRPLGDVWEAGQTNSVFLPGSRTIVTFFGPDVDATRTGSFEANKGRRTPLETTVSSVIRSSDIADLPLAGRDVYTMLVTQPGVSSDGATARGLGLAANGQRPSASNFLLDGLENNNYLLTGPGVAVAPQAIQEYRVSTNNYSAEYGRTSGYVANAITRGGANQLHGTAYLFLKNEILNANGFQENLNGKARAPYKESQPGYWVGGAVRRDRLFFSSAFEHFRSRGRQDAQTFVLPNVPVFQQFAPVGRQSRTLLDTYAPPAVGGNGVTGTLSLAPPVSVNRSLAIERVDWNPGARDRVTGTVLLARVGRPDFIWTPYKDFVSQFRQDTWRLSGSHVHTFSPVMVNEARAAFLKDDLGWDRPHAEVPTLVSGDGVTLPGSPAFYAYKNVGKSVELLDNLTWSRGAHRVAVGGGALLRSSEGYLTAGRDGLYQFAGITGFIQDRPTAFRAAIERGALTSNLTQPNYDREYRYQQYFGFVQDTFRVTPRLTANVGVRYESFGAPRNVGAVKDSLVVLGAGATLADRLVGAKLSAGDQLFGKDGRNVAVRAGASYDLFGTGRTLVRASYGIFYDRPFDNLWQNVRNNGYLVPQVSLTAATTNYLGPVQAVIDSLAGRTLNARFPSVTLMDPELRNGRVHSYFAGVQHQLGERVSLEVNALGSYGRRLITTDVVNREFSTAGNRYNNALPDVSYRSGQGVSDYNALAGVLRWQAARGMLQVGYTWSHAIDNQSEPLAGDFFNLNFTSIAVNPPASGRASFSRQFDARADRGNADFDQRHNLVAAYVVNWREWTLSGLAAVRSGQPYNLLGPTDFVVGRSFALNNRPDTLGQESGVRSQESEVAGGRRLLQAGAFAAAAPGNVGNVGRNALTGPGFYNFDVALGRGFQLREGLWLRFRADAFNVLNHANLGNPDGVLGGPTFGVAQYGRSGRASGFPAVSPLTEAGRVFQGSVRFEF